LVELEDPPLLKIRNPIDMTQWRKQREYNKQRQDPDAKPHNYHIVQGSSH
jgi:hypothetical protein